MERDGINRAGPGTSGAFENDFRDRRLGPQQGSDHEVRRQKSNGSHDARLATGRRRYQPKLEESIDRDGVGQATLRACFDAF